MHPILVRLGPFELPTYGVLLAIGLAVAIVLASRRARLVGLPGDRVADLGLWIVLYGLLGAKILLAVTEPSAYLTSLAGLWALARAGGVFYGGFIAAAVAAIVLLRRYRLRFLPVGDVLAPSVALGHFFGRLGCFSAGCCYGAQSASPLAVVFTNPVAHEVSGTPLGVPLYPTQLFEAVFNLLNYFFLAWLFRRRYAPGTVLAAYIIGYGTARFIIEFYRGDADRGFVLHGLLSTSQAIALVLVPLAVALLIWVNLRKHPA